MSKTQFIWESPRIGLSLSMGHHPTGHLSVGHLPTGHHPMGRHQRMFGGSGGCHLPLAALSFHFCLFSWMYLVQVERKLARSALMSPSSRCSSRDVCRHCELWGQSHQLSLPPYASP